VRFHVHLRVRRGVDQVATRSWPRLVSARHPRQGSRRRRHSAPAACRRRILHSRAICAGQEGMASSVCKDIGCVRGSSPSHGLPVSRPAHPAPTPAPAGVLAKRARQERNSRPLGKLGPPGPPPPPCGDSGSPFPYPGPRSHGKASQENAAAKKTNATSPKWRLLTSKKHFKQQPSCRSTDSQGEVISLVVGWWQAVSRALAKAPLSAAQTAEKPLTPRLDQGMRQIESAWSGARLQAETRSVARRLAPSGDHP